MPQVVHTAGNQKVALLTVMLANSDERGRVHVDADMLVRGTTLDMHDVTKTAWALQKQGLLKFKESKRDTTGGGVSVLSDFQLMQLERVRQMVNNGTMVGRPATRATKAALERSAERDEVTTVIERKPRSEPRPDDVDVPIEQEQIAAVLEVQRVLRHQFPSIAKLTGREGRIRAAADALSEEGLDELALQALEQVKFNPLESEVLELVKMGVIAFVEDV